MDNSPGISKLYQSFVITILVCYSNLLVFENNCLRSMLGKKLLKRVKIETSRRKVGVERIIIETVKKNADLAGSDRLHVEGRGANKTKQE